MLSLIAVAGLTIAMADGPAAFDAGAAQRFATLALECVHKEFPGKIAHVLNGDQDVQPPRTLTPAFFGCYDWHSSVHGHWLLARLTRTVPQAPFAPRARAALARSLTPEHIAAEVRYLEGPGRTSFERPYGLAWLLQLAAELRTWDDPEARTWSAALRPLEAAAATRLKAWLPKLTNPIRIGEHDQTAFAFGLVLDWARAAGDAEMDALLRSTVDRFYAKDTGCPLHYEPSGQDFLSPCLGEADLMRRVLPPERYAAWLGAFLPQLPRDGSAGWLAPAVVTDPSDPKLAHLDGLNLSRAWMLLGMARGLPSSDTRIAALRAAAAAHREAGLRAVTGAHYEGGHWLGTFAVYLVTAEDAVRAAAPAATEANASVADRVAALTRASTWTLERAIPMTFPAHHPQGLVKIGDRLFFSSVELTTPPRRGAGGGGFDRDTGQGVGHLFEATMDGTLVADVVLGEGTIYHPGGLDFDGRDIWVPVAEYRPDSRSIVYRVDPATRKPVEVFRFGDHLGGVAYDTETRTLHAVSWGSRWFYRFPLDASGRPTNAGAPPATLRTANRSHYVDYQDCKYVGAQRMLCSGIADVPGAAGERPLQLGGIDLVDLASAAPLHQLPVGLRTPGGASLTRNPSFFEVAEGGGIRAWFLPDDDTATLYVYRVQ